MFMDWLLEPWVPEALAGVSILIMVLAYVYWKGIEKRWWNANLRKPK